VLRTSIQIGPLSNLLRFALDLIVTQKMLRLRYVSNTRCGTSAVRQSLLLHTRTLFGSSTLPKTDEEIIVASNWKAGSPFKRLGLKPWQASTSNVKRHHRVLAKHFHPDSGNDKEGNAFKSIQEAYEQLSRKKPSTETSNAGEEESDDTKKRRSQVRFLGSAVNIFLFAAVVYVLVVARHNKQRLGKSYMEYFVVMFLLLQVLPRLFASAIVFSFVSSLLVERFEAVAQSKALLVVEKLSPTSSKLRVDGFTDEEWNEMHIEVVLHENVVCGDDSAAGEASTNTAVTGVPSQSSHLKFNKGVRDAIIPIPGKQSQRTFGVDVYVVRDDTKLLVANKYVPY
jgi:hypothetical protein